MYHAPSSNQPVLSNEGKVSCTKKQPEPLIGLELTPDRHQPITSHMRYATILNKQIYIHFVLRLTQLSSNIQIDKVHCDSIITRSTGKTRVITDCVITDRVIYTRPLSHTKQMPHPPSFGMGHQSVYLVYSYNTPTFHKSRYQSVYVGRIIEQQLIYCIF